MNQEASNEDNRILVAAPSCPTRCNPGRAPTFCETSCRSSIAMSLRLDKSENRWGDFPAFGKDLWNCYCDQINNTCTDKVLRWPKSQEKLQLLRRENFTQNSPIIKIGDTQWSHPVMDSSVSVTVKQA